MSPTDLSVRLASRERGGLVPLEIVSQGTREAVALLLRVSIVDLLSNADEPVRWRAPRNPRQTIPPNVRFSCNP